ncbi:hypothetical protein SAMD00079811_73950 [Scytonema sp. HK-05]|uniref:hypothetical protein n=1 Tax=Scytonema sp. HK-05 TaxID=1137095 RepID=UPI000B601FC2|nr:hypothetical protein [Scytonema sp. HK-05]BAY49766.1 hypothetical protein SAMD00079811_73950 [Scytonema sp. HK-05]
MSGQKQMMVHCALQQHYGRDAIAQGAVAKPIALGYALLLKILSSANVAIALATSFPTSAHPHSQSLNHP